MDVWNAECARCGEGHPITGMVAGNRIGLVCQQCVDRAYAVEWVESIVHAGTVGRQRPKGLSRVTILDDTPEVRVEFDDNTFALVKFGGCVTISCGGRVMILNHEEIPDWIEQNDRLCPDLILGE